MKKCSIATACIICLVPFISGALTGDEAVEKFKARYSRIGAFKGIISISHSSGETMTGAFKYMAPGKFSIKFASPAGKEITTNGKRLWIYDKGSNVCGIQDVGGASGGLAGFIHGYTAISLPSGSSDTAIRLKSQTAFYRDVTIIVDSSFMVKKVVFRNEKGDGFSASFSNLSFDESISPGTFDFNVPSSAQSVMNPLDVR